LDYIQYPDTLNLEENFPLGEISFLRYGNIIEEINILDEIFSNLKKKSGNSIIKKNMSKAGQDLLKNPKNKFLNMFHLNNKDDGNSEINSDNEQMNNLRNKIKKVFDYYYNEKIKLKVNNSSLLSSLSELCSEYEVNYRKLLLCLIINVPAELNEFDLIYKIIFYKLLFLSSLDTQSDIINLMGRKVEKEPGFLVNYCNALYINIMKAFIDDFNFDFTRYKINHINIFCIAKILKLLCESHNIFFQEKLTNSIIFYFTKLEDCLMSLTMKSGFFPLNKTKSKNINFNVNINP
jgi:hypothetical protein